VYLVYDLLGVWFTWYIGYMEYGLLGVWYTIVYTGPGV